MFNAQQFAARLAARKNHWPLLGDWTETWCHSFQESDGYFEAELDRAESRLGVKLPAALKELYRFAGHRLSKLNDPLIEPQELEAIQNIIPFWAENQYVVTWGIKIDDLSLDDPAVYIDLNGCDSYGSDFMTPNRLVRQNDTFSEFVFQMAVWNYMKRGDALNTAEGEENVAELLQAYEPLGLPTWVQERVLHGRDVTDAVKFYGNEAGLACVTLDRYARCVSKDRSHFLRYTDKGRT